MLSLFNDRELLEKCVKESRYAKEAILKIGYTTPAHKYSLFKKYIKKYNIDISHFISPKEIKKLLQIGGYNKKYELSDILVENFMGNMSGNGLKQRLYKAGLKQPICELCGQDENWITGKIPMILDHINGNNKDNRIENLRIVCPNCDTTLPTYKGKNRHSNIDKSLHSVLYKNTNDYLDVIDKQKNKIHDLLKEGKYIAEISKEMDWGKSKTVTFIKNTFPEYYRFDKNKEYYRDENFIIEKKHLIQNNLHYIEFNKKGWRIRLAKLLNTTPQHSGKFIQKNFTEIWEGCFKHNDRK